MHTELHTRLENLKLEVHGAKGAERAALLEKMEQAVLSLETHGGRAPIWAREMIREKFEEETEGFFDNMPL